MPALQKIVGPRGKEIWKSFDPEDHKAVALALKEEFQRPESAHQIHCASASGGSRSCPMRLSFHCLRDCLVFLLCGEIFIDGQGALVEPGCANHIRDEEWLGLGDKTTILVMEQGEMKGICEKRAKEALERYWDEKESAQKIQERPWNRLLRKLR